MKKFIYILLLPFLACTDQEIEPKATKEQQILQNSVNFIVSSVPQDQRLIVFKKVSAAIYRDTKIVISSDALNTKDLESAGAKTNGICWWSMLTADVVNVELVDHGDGTFGLVYQFSDGCAFIQWPDEYLTFWDSPYSCYC